MACRIMYLHRVPRLLSGDIQQITRPWQRRRLHLFPWQPTHGVNIVNVSQESVTHCVQRRNKLVERYTSVLTQITSIRHQSSGEQLSEEEIRDTAHSENIAVTRYRQKLETLSEAELAQTRYADRYEYSKFMKHEAYKRKSLSENKSADAEYVYSSLLIEYKQKLDDGEVRGNVHSDDSMIQATLISDIIVHHFIGGFDKCLYLDPDTWEKIFNDKLFCEIHKLTVAKVFELIVTSYSRQYCQGHHDGYYEMACSLADYIIGKPVQHSDLYMRSLRLSLLHNHRGAEATDEIISSYHELRDKYPYVETTSANRLMEALGKTPLWTEYHRLIEDIQLTSKVANKFYLYVALAALYHDDVKTAYRMMLITGEMPKVEVLRAFLDVADIGRMDELLHMVGEEIWHLSTRQAMMITVWLEQHYKGTDQSWNCKTFTPGKSAACPHCHTELAQMRPLVADEVRFLCKTLTSKILIGGDQFTRTTPKRMDDFKAFLRANGPFDVIVDGMNLMLMHGTNTRPGTTQLLTQVLTEMLRRDYKVLTLADVAMQQHIRKQRWSRNVRFYYTKGRGLDDTMMIYATLTSGPEAYFVTRDELRDHCFKLGEDVRKLFKRWQYTRQITTISTGRGIITQWPESYGTMVQQTETGWHIPYRSLQKQNNEETQEQSQEQNHKQTREQSQQRFQQTYFNHTGTHWLCASAKAPT